MHKKEHFGKSNRKANKKRYNDLQEGLKYINYNHNSCFVLYKKEIINIFNLMLQIII